MIFIISGNKITYIGIYIFSHIAQLYSPGGFHQFKYKSFTDISV